jgi:hypothetical protein
MTSFSERSRNYTVLLITSLGIICLVLYYSIIYIPENEQRINARNFRVLYRIGANLTTTIDNYVDKIAQGYGKQVLEKNFDTSGKGEPPSKARKPIELQVAKVNNELLQLAQKDSIKGRDNGLSFVADQQEMQNHTHIKKEREGTYLHFASKIEYAEDKPFFKFNDPFYFHSRIRIDSLLVPLMRWDSFDYFAVFRKIHKDSAAQVIYYSAKDNHNSSFIDLLPSDSLRKMADQAAGQAPAEIAIAGESFKLFIINKQIAQNEDWILCAAVPSERYETERRAIPANTVTFACLLFAILLFSLPFLKLLLISKQERLSKSDVVFISLSVFAGVALLVLLLLNGYVYFGADNIGKAERLENLGSEIQNNLRREVEDIVANLKSIDANIDTYPGKDLLEVNLKKDIQIAQYFGLDRASAPHLVRVFWADAAGNISDFWTTKEQDRKYNVKQRDYFRNLANPGQGWTLGKTPDKFALESVSSMNDGRKYAFISIRSNRNGKAKIVALTTRLSSLYNPVLPPGYGFCIIDKEGKVLFHQQEDLNLNENLLEETNYPPALKAAIYSRVPTHFEINYQGNKQGMYISPIDKLPFFLVTYVNNDFQKVANLHLIMVTVMMLTLYYVILGFFLALVVYARSRPATLDSYWFSFKWLWPKKSYAPIYLITSWTLLVTIIFVLWVAETDLPVTTFFILLYAATYNFIFCYFNLHDVPITSTLRSRLYWFGVGAVVILVVLNSCAFMAGRNTFIQGFLFQVLLVMLFCCIKQLLINKPFETKLSYRYRRYYSLMLFSWLMLTCALPSFIFFRIAYNYEMDLNLRYDQLYLAERLSKQPATVAWPYWQQQERKTNKLAPASFVYAGFLHATRPSPDSLKVQAGKTASRSENLPPLLNKWRSTPWQLTFFPNLQVLFLGAKQALGLFTQEAEQDEAWQASAFMALVRPKFRNVLANAFFLKANCPPRADCHPKNWEVQDSLLHFTYTNELNQNNKIALTSRLPRFLVPAINKAESNHSGIKNYAALIFWFDACLLGFFIFFIISFLVQRIFSLGLHGNNPLDRLDKQFLDPTIDNKLLLITLPVAPDIKESIRMQHATPFTLIPIDLANGDFTAQIKHWKITSIKVPAVLLIKNFDFDPFSEVALKYKVMLLEKLMEVPGLKVIIQTSLHPACWQEKLEKEKESTAKEPSRAAYVVVLEQLLRHLSSCIKLYHPLQNQGMASPVKEKYLLSNQAYLKRLIQQECYSCLHLKQFESAFTKYVEDCGHNKKKISKAEIIFLLQERAQPYYRYIWTSCSEEEQYCLYDLAQDGLVNARNIDVLSALQGKGLLVQEEDSTLRIMNASFRDFVRHEVDPAWVLRYEKMTAQGSRWDLFKTPLVLILIAGALFIFFTQKQTWGNIVAVLAAVSTIVGVLPRMGALIPAIFASKEAKAGL